MEQEQPAQDQEVNKNWLQEETKATSVLYDRDRKPPIYPLYDPRLTTYNKVRETTTGERRRQTTM